MQPPELVRLPHASSAPPQRRHTCAQKASPVRLNARRRETLSVFVPACLVSTNIHVYNGLQQRGHANLVSRSLVCCKSSSALWIEQFSGCRCQRTTSVPTVKPSRCPRTQSSHSIRHPAAACRTHSKRFRPRFPPVLSMPKTIPGAHHLPNESPTSVSDEIEVVCCPSGRGI